MTQGQRFLQSNFTFGNGADQDTGTGIIGFDSDTGRFTSIWFDSRSTKMSIRQSDGKFDGDQIVLSNRSLNAVTTRPSRTSRTVSVLEDGDTKLIHRQYIRSANGNERLILELDMTRRPPATQPSP